MPGHSAILGSAYEGVVGWFNVNLHEILATVAIVLAFVFLRRVARRSLERSARRTAEHQRLDEWKTRALVSRTKPLSLAINAIILVVGFLAVLGVWRLQAGFVSLLTAAGFAGIVIGLAAASSLSNFIAGFQIFYNHPFDIGDWVEIDGEQGLVIDVRAGATMMETWDGEKVTFPNRLVEGNKVRNFSHQRKLRRRFAVGVDYATDIGKARSLLLDLVKSHPDVLHEPAPEVVGIKFGDSSIDLEIRYWVLPLRAQVMVIQTWLMQEIQRLFAREGIVIPYPQRTVAYRYAEGNPAPGETVSRLSYDPATDTTPFPAPPLRQNAPNSSPSSRQGQPLFHWIPSWQLGRRKRRDDDADAVGDAKR